MREGSFHGDNRRLNRRGSLDVSVAMTPPAPFRSRGCPPNLGDLRFSWVWVACLVLGSALGSLMAPAATRADFRSEYMVRLLTTSSSFRVRAQAALALGDMSAEPEVLEALTGALDDQDSSVRVAAANSLHRLGDPSVLGALRAATTQGDAVFTRSVRTAIRALERVAPSAPAPAEVPSGPVRYYVGVGDPGTSVEELSPAELAQMREFLVERVSGMDGVVIAPAGESNSAAGREIRSRRLTGFYLDSTITSVGPRDGGMRADVSIILNTYPGRSMRAMLRGGATVVGGSGNTARRQAIRGAVRGALRTLAQVMMATAARPDSR